MPSPKSGDLRIDDAAECIWRDGEKIGVPPKAFLVLRRLMQRPAELVTKSELLEAVWPDTYVTDIVLNNAVGQLRQALGDNPKQPRFIETVHRRGFRWIGPVNAEAPSGSASTDTLHASFTLHAAEANTDTAFVGRTESLAELARCYARAAAGQRQLVLVSGEPGIGKTTLVDQFAASLVTQGSSLATRRSSLARSAGKALPQANNEPRATSNVLLARGQCIETYGAGDLYRPLREAVEQLLRDGGEETRAVFRKHAPSWFLSIPELASAAELEELRRSVITTKSESAQRELERAIEAASAERPIVLVLEDLHWSDPATVTLLWALAARREPAKVLIIGTYRSADAIALQHPITRLKHELTAKRQCVELALDGLQSDSVVAFLDRHYARHELPGGLAARLHEQTAGNPLFLLNALADLERRGWLQEEDGVWRCTVDLDSVSAAVPESTRSLIAFRLDQLSPETAEMLEAASIVGGTFATQTVAAATERDCTAVEAELEPLARAALFLKGAGEIEWPDGTHGSEYEFRHALYRQVLLRRITPARRQVLHRRIALGLERGYGERVSEVAGALSLHHEQAGDVFRTVDYIEMLVQQANARSAVHEAEAMLGHALSLLKRAQKNAAQQQRLLKVSIAHAIALATVRGMTNAESQRAFEEARVLGQSMPSPSDHVATLSALVLGKVSQGQLHEARRLAEEVFSLTRGDQSPDDLIIAHLGLATTLVPLGEVEASIRHLEHAHAILNETSPALGEPGSHASEVTTFVPLMLGYSLMLSGRLKAGRELIESALRIARTVQTPWFRNYSVGMAVMLTMIRGDLIDTRELAKEALVYGEKIQFAEWTEYARMALGWVNLLETRDPKLIEPLSKAVDAFRTTGRVSVSRTYGFLADACLAVGRIEEAANALDAAFDTRGEERTFDGQLLRLRALSLLGRAESSRSKKGLRAEAEQTLEQAIEVSNRYGTHLFGLRATVDLCRLWLATGKRSEARQRLGEALSAFDEGFDETDLREARALLDELG